MRKNTERHPFPEVMIVLSGSHVYGVDGQLYAAEPGTVFLFDREVSHDSGYSRWQGDCVDLWLSMGVERRVGAVEDGCRNHHWSAEAAWQKGGSPWYEPLYGPIVDTVHACWHDLRSEPGLLPLAWLRLKAALTTMLIAMAMRRRGTTEDSDMSAEHAGEVIAHIKRYIGEHLRDELCLSKLSQLSGYAPFYFHRLFYRFTRSTPHAYVRYARIERARHLLREGRAVQSVAEEVGFGSAASFSRVFHEMMGRAPLHWARAESRRLRIGKTGKRESTLA